MFLQLSLYCFDNFETERVPKNKNLKKKNWKRQKIKLIRKIIFLKCLEAEEQLEEAKKEVVSTFTNLQILHFSCHTFYSALCGLPWGLEWGTTLCYFFWPRHYLGRILIDSIFYICHMVRNLICPIDKRTHSLTLQPKRG